MADGRREFMRNVIEPLAILAVCVALIWLIVDKTYQERGYSAPVPEIRFDHDCTDDPPNFLLRLLVEKDRPEDLALFVRVDNFGRISAQCTYIDLFLVPHGSKAVVTDVWANRLSDTPYFRTANGQGFALRFRVDGTGQHTPVIEFPNAIHRRSFEHFFFWLHFAKVSRRPGIPAGTLAVEFDPSPNFLIDGLPIAKWCCGLRVW